MFTYKLSYTFIPYSDHLLEIIDETMAETQVLVDALPYIDQGYDDVGVREMVTAMVEEETRYTSNYLQIASKIIRL